MKVKEILPLIEVKKNFLSPGLLIKGQEQNYFSEDAQEMEVEKITTWSLAMDESTIVIFVH